MNFDEGAYFYSVISNLELPLVQVLDLPVESYFDGRLYKNKIWVGTVEGLELYQLQYVNYSCFFCVSQLLILWLAAFCPHSGLPVYFIEPLHPSKFFWRNQFYGEQDDFKRFSYFSRAALELVHQAGKKPDIIHSHDWQTAFVV